MCSIGIWLGRKANLGVTVRPSTPHWEDEWGGVRRVRLWDEGIPLFKEKGTRIGASMVVVTLS